MKELNKDTKFTLMCVGIVISVLVLAFSTSIINYNINAKRIETCIERSNLTKICELKYRG